MKLTDTTPPSEKTFTLELNENDLQMLGLIMGSISHNRLEAFFDEESWRLDNYPTIKRDIAFVDDLFCKITAITRKF